MNLVSILYYYSVVEIECSSSASHTHVDNFVLADIFNSSKSVRGLVNEGLLMALSPLLLATAVCSFFHSTIIWLFRTLGSLNVSFFLREASECA